MCVFRTESMVTTLGACLCVCVSFVFMVTIPWACVCVCVCRAVFMVSTASACVCVCVGVCVCVCRRAGISMLTTRQSAIVNFALASLLSSENRGGPECVREAGGICSLPQCLESVRTTW